ncbi:unnamed protein product, partial [Didymodactylos carnosus]
IIGLGGGLLPTILRHYYPTVNITIVEIDPMVVELAQKYFNFKYDSALNVIISDGREYIRKLVLNENKKFDLIMFDAYEEYDIIPFYMKTREFFQELNFLLKPNIGILVTNLVYIYKSYSRLRKTLSLIFDKNYSFLSQDLVNVIVISSNDKIKLTKQELLNRALKLETEKHF